MQSTVLEGLIELGGAATKEGLFEKTGVRDAPRVLRQIREAHPTLAPHIKLPGGKGKGGYQTTIKRAATKPPQ